jgi:hypothetical protein
MTSTEKMIFLHKGMDVLRLGKVTFDNNFTPIKSKYICVLALGGVSCYGGEVLKVYSK